MSSSESTANDTTSKSDIKNPNQHTNDYMGNSTSTHDTSSLMGKSLDEAKLLIKEHDVFYGEVEHPITEICVVRVDGEPQSRIKDIRRFKGRMRLNVHIKSGKITKIESVG